jgi:hypothetical protein
MGSRVLMPSIPTFPAKGYIYGVSAAASWFLGGGSGGFNISSSRVFL